MEEKEKDGSLLLLQLKRECGHEALKFLLPLHLASVIMDTGARVAPGIKKVIQTIASFLCLD